MLQYPLIRSFFDFSIESEKVDEGNISEDEIIDEEEDRRKRRNFRLSRSSRSGELQRSRIDSVFDILFTFVIIGLTQRLQKMRIPKVIYPVRVSFMRWLTKEQIFTEFFTEIFHSKKCVRSVCEVNLSFKLNLIKSEYFMQMSRN